MTVTRDRLAAALGPDLVAALALVADAAGAPGWRDVAEQAGVVDRLVRGTVNEIRAAEDDPDAIRAMPPLARTVVTEVLRPTTGWWWTSRRAVTTAVCEWLGVRATRDRTYGSRRLA